MRLWNATTGTQLHSRTLPYHFSCIAFFPDGRIIIGGYDANVSVWEKSTESAVLTLSGHKSDVTCVDCNSDGSRAVTGSLDTTLRMWDVNKGTELWCEAELPWKRTLNDRAWSVAFSRDGRYFSTGHEDGAVGMWNTEPGANHWKNRLHDGKVTGIAFSPDGRFVASAATDETIRLWDAENGRELSCVALGSEPRVSGTQPLVFSPDRQWLMVIIVSGVLRLSTDNLYAETERSSRGSVRTECFAFSPDGARFAVVGKDGVVQLRNANTGTELCTLLRGSGNESSIATFPDGRRVVSMGRKSGGKIWETEARREWEDIIEGWEGLSEREYLEAMRVPSTYSAVLCVAFFSDGRRIATGGQDSSVRVWDIQTGKELKRLRIGFGDVRSIAVSPSGDRIASANSDKVHVWSVSTGKLLYLLEKDYGSSIHCIAFSHDGKSLATGGLRYVDLWDLHTKKIVWTDATTVHCAIAFSRDGRRVVARRNAPGSTEAWNVQTGAICEDQRDDELMIVKSYPEEDRYRVTVGNEDTTIQDSRTGESIAWVHGHFFHAASSNANSLTCAMSSGSEQFVMVRLEDG